MLQDRRLDVKRDMNRLGAEGAALTTRVSRTCCSLDAAVIRESPVTISTQSGSEAPSGSHSVKLLIRRPVESSQVARATCFTGTNFLKAAAAGAARAAGCLSVLPCEASLHKLSRSAPALVYWKMSRFKISLSRRHGKNK